MTSLHASGVQIKQMENNSPAVCLVEPEAHASFRLAGCRHAASAGGKTFRAIGKRTSSGRSDLSRPPNQQICSTAPKGPDPGSWIMHFLIVEFYSIL
jgi:hypothetical protein